MAARPAPGSRALRIGLLAACLLAQSRPSDGDKVIFTPLPGAESHMFILGRMALEMHARGHEVMMVIAETDWSTLMKLNHSGMEVVTYEAAYTKHEIKELVQASRRRSRLSLLAGLESFLSYYQALFDYCDCMMLDTAMHARILAWKPDLLVGDINYACSKGIATFILGGVPRVLVSALPILDPLVPGRLEAMPNPLAYNPQMVSGLGPRMGALGRLQNVLFWVGSKAIERFKILPMYERICRKHRYNCWTPELVSGTTLFLYNVDYALDYPRPLPQTVKACGAFLPRPAAPVPPRIEAILAGAGERGAIYVSFGTLCNVAASELLAVARAVSSLPHTVIWKMAAGDLPGNTSVGWLGLAGNVHVVDWAPQNDLLGDARVVAFFTHGGLNSIYEAAYHGVPVVGMPIFGDQLDNVAKAVNRGFGLLLDPARTLITAARVRAALLRVASEPAFGAAARVISRRMRAHTRTPLQQAADWLEHALATDGVPYLKTPEHEMWWWERWLLDAALLGFALLGLAVATVLFAARVLGLPRLWAPGSVATGLFSTASMDLADLVRSLNTRGSGSPRTPQHKAHSAGNGGTVHTAYWGCWPRGGGGNGSASESPDSSDCASSEALQAPALVAEGKRGLGKARGAAAFWLPYFGASPTKKEA